MPPQPSQTTITMGILLAGAWTVLAWGLGAILSVPLAEPDRASASSEIISVQATGTDPCTGELVNVEGRLTTNVIPDGEAGGTSVDAVLRLENYPGTPHNKGIEPLIQRLFFYKTPLSSTPSVFVVRTPLAGRSGYLDLVVNLLGGVTDRGDVSLSPSSARIDVQRSPCSGSPPSPLVTEREQGTLGINTEMILQN